jgi:hypothetical protein
MADEDDAMPLRRVAARLHVHLGDERAGRVDRVEAALRRALVDGWRDTVGREHERRAGRHVRLGLDEDRPALLQLPHHMGVVDDLLAHVDGRSVQGQRTFHRLDGAFDPSAISPRRCEQDSRNQTVGHGSNGPNRPPG